MLALSTAAPATAATVPVLHPDGTLGERVDPGVAARERGLKAPVPRATSARTGAALARLARLRDKGAIDDDAYDGYRRELRRDRALARTLEGRRRAEMAGVLRTLDRIAARGALTRSRLTPLWLQLRRNREWWSKGPLLSAGARVSFPGTELVFQYVPGEGLAIHPLANFGKLNYLARPRSDHDRMARLAAELMPLAANRAGGIAWEYYFPFDGGSPPWVSSLAQGTGLQALARAADRAGTLAEAYPVLRRGLGVFERRTPVGVSVPAGAGDHYAQYSFAPGLRILNGFIQSLNGLHDFAALTADPDASRLFAAGLARAREEVPAYDTGAWSLYDRGTDSHESNLNYHDVLTDFLGDLCRRTDEAAFCDTAARFRAYRRQDPRVSLLTSRMRAGKRSRLRVRLSKISSVRLSLSRGGEVVYTSTATLGRGVHAFAVKPPRKAREYAVRVDARDLAGNATTLDGTVEIQR